jgi:hypothetical protein
MKSNRARFAALAFASLAASPASAATIDLFVIGSTHTGGAIDPFGNPIAGTPIVSWTDTLFGAPTTPMVLSILAEGVDGGDGAPGGGEFDGVYVNGSFVGHLTQQGFYSPDYMLQPGPGALAGRTAETVSLFDVTAFLVAGLNTFEVRIDPSNWVNEIEVASLRAIEQVPEPSSAPLALAALAALALVRVAGAQRSARSRAA